jgi:hypothetical protein
LLLTALYGVFGMEPLYTGQLSNIPADKRDRFDLVKELPALQRMAGAGAVYHGMRASGLRADGSLDLRGGGHSRLTFLLPRGDGSHDQAVVSIWPPGFSRGGWSMLGGLRWERGINVNYHGFNGDAAAPAAPTCDLAAMIAHARRAALPPSPLGSIELEHREGVYTITFKGAAAGGGVDTIERAGRGPSHTSSGFDLVSATSVEFGADCQPR